ncbi:MAG TPA: GGDEF domain-containing phosphodiesterase, partial [Baekduia sp.]|nr:GGDEF domain-containing phosphodiesterase [Baekduia sp.]
GSLRQALRDASQPGAGPERRVTASIGISLFDHDAASTAEDLLARADIAMYDAKEAGGDRVAVYDAAAPRHRGMRDRLEWTSRIERALDQDRFVLHAQPILPLADRTERRFELLLRMTSPDGDLIPPGTFLYVAERSDLAQRIDRWVVQRAVAMLAEQQRAGDDVAFEVNLSARSVNDPAMLDFLTATIAGAAIDPSKLTFEITETAAIVNLARATAFSDRLRAVGCQFALDDFGTGFSSFSYLKHLGFDFLKIDGEFVKDLVTNPTNRLIVRSIVDIARGLGRRTIAEYVGDEATVALLRRYGVDYAQGFHVGRPAPFTPLPQAAPPRSAR